VDRWIASEGVVACFSGDVRCPASVTPQYLHDGKGQGVCGEDRLHYYCEATCTTAGDVVWTGGVCEEDQVSPCPPWDRTLVQVPKSSAADSEPPKRPSDLHGPEVKPPAAPAEDRALRQLFTGRALLLRATDEERAVVESTQGFVLRGIQVCEPAHSRCEPARVLCVCVCALCVRVSAFAHVRRVCGECVRVLLCVVCARVVVRCVCACLCACLCV
jgi:hypothetical protein